MEHADYPHLPGALWDCPACEAECFCEPLPAAQYPCVFCDAEEEMQ